MNNPIHKKKILLIQWSGSNYDSLRHLQDLLGTQFQTLGFEIEKLALNDPQFIDILINFLQSKEIYFAMGFSGVGVDVYDSNKQLIWEAFKTPFFNWCCDHPCYFPARHQLSSPWVIHGFVFPDHARYSNDFFNANGITFQAHLGAPVKKPAAQMNVALKNRNNKIIYAKSGTDIDAIEKKWLTMPESIRKILFSAKEELQYQSTENAFEVIKRLADEENIFLSPNNAFALNIIREIDIYIRGWRANLAIKSLLNYPVDVYGNGWDHMNVSQSKGATFHGALDLASLLNIFPNYLGCLSINPFIEDSVHDRVFYALAENVVPLSDQNRFSITHLPLLQKYSFKFNQESIISSVEQLLENPSNALELTHSTQVKLEEKFSLDSSAKKIIEFVSHMKFNFKRFE